MYGLGWCLLGFIVTVLRYMMMGNGMWHFGKFVAAYVLGRSGVRLYKSLWLLISDKQGDRARIYNGRSFVPFLSHNRTLVYVTIMCSIFVLQCEAVSFSFPLFNGIVLYFKMVVQLLLNPCNCELYYILGICLNGVVWYPWFFKALQLWFLKSAWN